MKYKVYMKRTVLSPWVIVESYGDRDAADRLADKYQRDYPKSRVEVISE